MARAMVIGVDGSDAAAAVVTQAAALAGRLGLAPVLAHVVEDQPGFRQGMATERERQSQVRRSADMLARRHRATAGAEHRLLFGDPPWALERLAADVDAALIAVGSRGRGRGRLKSALTGSVSLALATKSRLPVLVVPPGATSAEEHRLPRAIVCGVDDSEHVERTVRAAADLARALRLRLLLVHAQGGPASLAMMPTAGVGAQVDHHARLMERQREAAEETLGRAVRLAAGDDLVLGTRLEAGDVAEMLEQVAVDEDAGLIAVGTHSQGAVRAALVGSTSSQLVGLASRPVLIVPPRARLALEAVAVDAVA